MIGNRRVFGIEALRRRIEKVSAVGTDSGDDFGGDAAPGKTFSHTKQASRARDRREDRFRIERLHAAQIDDFDLETFCREFIGGAGPAMTSKCCGPSSRSMRGFSFVASPVFVPKGNLRSPRR